MPRTLSQGAVKMEQRRRLLALQQQQSPQQPSQPSPTPTVTLSSNEERLIDRYNINLTTIDRRNLLKQLTLAGISPERAREIMAANEPQLKVFGRTSQGLVVQGGGYTYDTGKKTPRGEPITYTGTEDFLLEKSKQDITVQTTQENGYQKQTTYFKGEPVETFYIREEPAPRITDLSLTRAVEEAAASKDNLFFATPEEMGSIYDATGGSFLDTVSRNTFTPETKVLTKGPFHELLFNPDYFKVIPVQSPLTLTPGLGIKEVITPTEYQARMTKLPGKVVGELLPKTLFEAGTIVAGGYVYSKLPTIVRVGVSGTIGYYATKQALNAGLPPEKRIASGIIGGLGIAGGAIEALPYIRGAVSRVSPGYQPVVTAKEGFKAVQLPKTQVGLIEPGSPLREGITTGVKLPKTSPLVRGGFGRTPGGEQRFIGKNQFLSTSQRGFFATGKEIKLQKEFFVTPEEPTLNIPETRVSRLALQETFEFPKSSEIGFGLPLKPQIGLTVGSVGRIETGSQFAIGKGTELEAIKTFGVIKNIRQIGTTTIQGQGVDIYTYTIGKGLPGVTSAISRTRLTTAGGTFISGYGIVSAAVSSRVKTTTTKPTIRTISATIELPSPMLTASVKPTSTYTPSISKMSIPTSPRVTRATPSTVSPLISKPVSISVPTARISKPTTVKLFPETYGRRKPNAIITTVKMPSSRYLVEVRRFGKFKPIGVFSSMRQAFAVGRGKVARTLAATFRVKGPGALRTPKGFYSKITPQGRLFIQQPKLRLSTGTERAEISMFRKIKRRKR